MNNPYKTHAIGLFNFVAKEPVTKSQEQIYNKFMDSKFRWANFSGLDHREWNIETDESGTTIINKHTGDEFSYQSLNIQSRHFYDAYKSRAMYKIPHTPQVIIPDRTTERDRLDLFVERGSMSLDQILRKSRCEGTFISIVKTVMRVVQILIKKYGYFRVTSKMIKSSRSGHLLVWFHEYTSSNFREFPITSNRPEEDTKTVILDILGAFEQHGERKVVNMLRQKTMKEKNMSFQKIITIMQSQNTILSCLPQTAKPEQEKGKNNYFRSPQFIKKKSIHDSLPKYPNNDPRKTTIKKDLKQFEKLTRKISANNEGKQENMIDKKKIGTPIASPNYLISSPTGNNNFKAINFQKYDVNKSLALQKQSKSQRKQMVQGKSIATPSFHKNRWASNQIQMYDKTQKTNEHKKFLSPNKVPNQHHKNCFHSHSFIPQNDKLVVKTYQSNTNAGIKGQRQFFNFIPNSPQDKTQNNHGNGLFKNSTTANLLMTQSTQNLSESINNSGYGNQKQYTKTSQNTDNLKKASFRDSGNSLATTNFLNSITSSGRTKLIDEQSLSQSKNGLVSSFGEKQKMANKLDSRFTVKASKIIEQKSEDWVPNSVQSMANTKSERDLGSQFDLQRDLDSILWSDKNPTKRSMDVENEMKALESEIKNILDF